VTVDLAAERASAGVDEIVEALDRDLVGLRPVKTRINEIAALLLARSITYRRVVSAIDDRYREPLPPIVPIGLSPQAARHSGRTAGQPSAYRRHMTRVPTPSPRARTQQGSDPGSRRIGTPVPLVAVVVPAAHPDSSASPSVPPAHPTHRTRRTMTRGVRPGRTCGSAASGTACAACDHPPRSWAGLDCGPGCPPGWAPPPGGDAEDGALMLR
jgi:hypothetical protein